MASDRVNLLSHPKTARGRTACGLLLLLLLLSLAPDAQGQVSVDMKALDSLGPAPPRAAPPPARRQVATPAPRPPAAAATDDHAARQATASPTQGAASPPVGAAAGSPTPVLPAAQPAMPPPVTLVPAPPPPAAPLPPPVRLVFEEGKTDLTPSDEAAIQALARSMPAPSTESINVVAYAAGKPDDPSTARRLSLSRGLAVRSVLLASGVPSAQIYVRALGASASDGPADRVELTVAPIGTVTR